MSVVLSNVRSLTAEHISGMAPDHTTLRAAVELARSDRWTAYGRGENDATPDGRLLWAEFPESRHDDTRTTISLPDLRATCTCSATRFPCRHIIAVLLRDATDDFDSTGLPDWVRDLSEQDQNDPLASDSAAVSGQRAAVIAGMIDLSVWLGDLVRQGLAGLPGRGRTLWLDAADRLVDAYAFEAARELRDCSLIPASGADWPERLLPRLGKLALLCEAFRRFDRLSPGEQGDALAAAAVPPHSAGPGVCDNWLVAGRRTEVENRQRLERTWLYGVESGRWALHSVVKSMGRTAAICWPTGVAVSGELAYYPSAAPLAAEPLGDVRLVLDPVPDPGRGATSIDEARALYAAALAVNPWLRVYPMALRDVFVEPPQGRIENCWWVRGRGGRTLPLPDRFAYGWQLLALTAGAPLTLFGEWDGAVFTPLSVLDGDWRAMSGWRGLA